MEKKEINGLKTGSGRVWQRAVAREVQTSSEGYIEVEESDELLNALTVDYITRREAGEQPDLVEYTTRYPEVAAEFKLSVVYYELKGRELIEKLKVDEEAPDYIERLQSIRANTAERERKAELFARMFPESADPNRKDEGGLSGPPSSSDGKAINSLLEFISKSGKKPLDVARGLNAAFDILVALEMRIVHISGLPRRLVNDFAREIGVSQEDILEYVKQPPLSPGFSYNKDIPEALEKHDFISLIIQSTQLTADQKEFWLSEAATDAYADAER